jgi:hypothetical protein
VSNKRWWAERISGLAGRNEIRSYSDHDLHFYHLNIKDNNNSNHVETLSTDPHAATQLLDAATNYGFVFIENNAAAGVPPANVQDMFDLVSTLVLKNRNRRLMVGIE